MTAVSVKVVAGPLVASGTDYCIFKATGAAAPHVEMVLVADNESMGRPPVEGETWSVDGSWVRHPTYGRRMRVEKAVLERPSGRLIVHLLSGPAFPGVGPKTARALWDALGESLYDRLDERDACALLAVLTENQRTIRQVETILTGWQDSKLEPDVCLWLDRHGFPPRLARKVMDCYGEEAIAKLEENPYRLTAFTPSWRAVDSAARGMGIRPEDPRRLVAAVEAALYAAYDRSHTAVPEAGLAHAAESYLGSAKRARSAMDLAVEERAVERSECGWQALGPAAMERTVARRLRAVLSGEDAAGLTRQLLHKEFDEVVVADAIAAFEAEEGTALNAGQREAVRMACSSRLSLLTGGAGVGKTTALKAILAATSRLGWTARLMALSGRAALRMKEATGHPATTIRAFLHSVAEADDEPLIVIDECSMVDLPLMFELLQRLPPGCRLLLVGDPGQLPPIAPGLVFHALVEDEAIPQVRLTETMRQAARTGIPAVAEAIREGRAPQIPDFSRDPDAGVTFWECEQEDLVDGVLDLMGALGGVGSAQVVGSIKGGLDPYAPDYKPGCRAINEAFHRLAIMGREDRVLFGRFLPGQPVIWLQNDRVVGLMNGELGVVSRRDRMVNPEYEAAAKRNGNMAGIDPMIPCLVIASGGREVSITEHDAQDLQRIDLAYAISTHKAQGSQMPIVVIPVTASQIMDRTMLYTAVTRAREKVVLVGSREVFRKAVVDPPSYSVRATGMQDALRAAARG